MFLCFFPDCFLEINKTTQTHKVCNNRLFFVLSPPVFTSVPNVQINDLK